MGESHIPSPKHTSSQEFDLDVALRARNHDQPEFSTVHGFVIDPVAGSPWPHLAPESRSVSLPAHGQLPSKAVALELVQETFNNYNRFLPLFDEEDFLREFHLKYSTSNPEDASWWACLNVVLSIAHRLRGLRTSNPAHENNLAGVYMKNALSVVSELNVASISAVQALVGMACILQGTPNPEPASMLVAAALRLAQALDLHREASDPSLTEKQAEIRRRVFWKVYVLDKDISLRTCRPFSQDDDDMDVRLPSNTNLDSCNVELFNHLAMLLHSFFAAASSMLYNLTQNPTSPSAFSDLHLLKPFLHLLVTLAKDPRTYARSEELRRMHNTCTSLHNEANKAVHLFRLEYTAAFA
ncbi:fungal specific transcription factor [Colletotrichum chrysophilum]|uniref:Fungal specific transcription factor n=1 Tax=Colletotrichum chrysophilum TaxID=1836956 RepID=A0AAD9A774_9PEZI|nr:fungal specific transcription factor [Colletotrichum chrysophilum]